MSEIPLPALCSDDPLGFLAALGVVELVTSELGLAPSLRWDGLGGTAVLRTDLEDVGALARELAAIAPRWSATGRWVPPPRAEFLAAPLSTSIRRDRRVVAGGVGEPLDPMRMTRRQALDRFTRQRDEELAGDRTGARWLAGLVNQLGLERQEARCELTPLYARTGQQNLHQLYKHYGSAVVARPGLIDEALLSWRRVDGDSGANLDGRALRDAAERTSGKSANAAVPGVTWLALMSAPFFRQVGDGRQPRAVGWRRIGRMGRPRSLVWPVWDPFLDRAAIDVLLAHPEVDRVTELASSTSRRGAVEVGRRGSLDRYSVSYAEVGRRLAALGVVAVCRADRRTLGNSDGPLGTATVVWPA